MSDTKRERKPTVPTPQRPEMTLERWEELKSGAEDWPGHCREPMLEVLRELLPHLAERKTKLEQSKRIRPPDFIVRVAQHLGPELYRVRVLRPTSEPGQWRDITARCREGVEHVPDQPLPLADAESLARDIAALLTSEGWGRVGIQRETGDVEIVACVGRPRARAIRKARPALRHWTDSYVCEGFADEVEAFEVWNGRVI